MDHAYVPPESSADMAYVTKTLAELKSYLIK